MDRLGFWNGNKIVGQLDMPGDLTDEVETWGAAVVTFDGSDFRTYHLDKIVGQWEETPAPGSGDVYDSFADAFGVISRWVRKRWTRLEREAREIDAP